MDRDRFPFDPLEEPDFKELYPAALEDGLDALRHMRFFHTSDLAAATPVRDAHRWAFYEPGFQKLVEDWLQRNAFLCGVRGPLPGEPELGSRWSFYDEAASPKEP
ncbi:MAG: hypothetical protein KC635_03625 [Myxococcales bacterium]|nr:hypothetical protein [Myxococcales bacterium]MCB9734791.1 hypothetical protein [Deltaproteobacteria bacterium]